MSDEKKVEVVSEALKAEEQLKSQWYILTLEGDLVTLDEFDFKGHDGLRTYSGYEVEKDRTVSQEPPHVGLMKSLELVDYEPASDPGNFRYYPQVLPEGENDQGPAGGVRHEPGPRLRGDGRRDPYHV
jgi:threonyl-tRNA synthetase